MPTSVAEFRNGLLIMEISFVYLFALRWACAKYWYTYLFQGYENRTRKVIEVGTKKINSISYYFPMHITNRSGISWSHVRDASEEYAPVRPMGIDSLKMIRHIGNEIPALLFQNFMFYNFVFCVIGKYLLTYNFDSSWPP